MRWDAGPGELSWSWGTVFSCDYELRRYVKKIIYFILVIALSRRQVFFSVCYCTRISSVLAARPTASVESIIPLTLIPYQGQGSVALAQSHR